MTDLIRHECEGLIARAGRAYRYTMGTLDDRDAGDIIYDCQPVTRWYPIETFSEDGVLDCVLRRYHYHAELKSLIHTACQRVWIKWTSTGDTAWAAEDWAYYLVREYAKEGGIELTERACVTENGTQLTMYVRSDY